MENSIDEVPLKINGSTLTKGVFNTYYENHYELEEWDRFVKDHIDNSIMMKSAFPMEITNEDILRYEGDFFGFLKSKGFNEAFHWIQLFNNRMRHPSEFTEKIKIVFLIPDDRLTFLYSRFDEVYRKHEDVDFE